MFSLSLAVATSEEVAALRGELERLRQEFEGRLTSALAQEAVSRVDLSRQLMDEVKDALGKLPDKDEFYDHLTKMEKK